VTRIQNTSYPLSIKTTKKTNGKIISVNTKVDTFYLISDIRINIYGIAHRTVSSKHSVALSVQFTLTHTLAIKLYKDLLGQTLLFWQNIP